MAVYKKFPNHVEAFDAQGRSLGIVFETATPFDTPNQMKEIAEWTQQSLVNQELHPLLVIGMYSLREIQIARESLNRHIKEILNIRQAQTFEPTGFVGDDRIR